MRPNEYRLLKRHNNTRYEVLTPSSRDTVEAAMESIRKASWNLYEQERVRQDLIGMAEKAEANEKTLAQVLGPDRQNLFDEMAREIEPGSFVDWFCLCFSRGYILFHAACMAFDALLGEGIRSEWIFLLVPAMIPVGFLVACLQRRIWISVKPRRFRRTMLALLATTLAVLLIGVMIQAVLGRSADLRVAKTWALVAFELLLYAGSRLVCRFRYNQTARRHPWR